MRQHIKDFKITTGRKAEDIANEIGVSRARLEMWCTRNQPVFITWNMKTKKISRGESIKNIYQAA